MGGVFRGVLVSHRSCCVADKERSPVMDIYSMERGGPNLAQFKDPEGGLR